MNSLMRAGTAESNPAMSSMPASVGSAIVNFVAVIPITIRRASNSYAQSIDIVADSVDIPGLVEGQLNQVVTESNALHERLLSEADQRQGCRGHAAGQVRSRNGLSHRARHVECEAESLSSRGSIDEGLVEGLLKGVIDLRVDMPVILPIDHAVPHRSSPSSGLVLAGVLGDHLTILHEGKQVGRNAADLVHHREGRCVQSGDVVSISLDDVAIVGIQIRRDLWVDLFLLGLLQHFGQITNPALHGVFLLSGIVGASRGSQNQETTNQRLVGHLEHESARVVTHHISPSVLLLRLSGHAVHPQPAIFGDHDDERLALLAHRQRSVDLLEVNELPPVGLLQIELVDTGGDVLQQLHLIIEILGHFGMVD
ncbi:hypothetical protein WR25_25130 [Diploscapter pachys]|uniref:Uncharacterized protein n=1 Tax=Diploscapter pachys TaxID=2018661 RepID=A0A2A2LVT7_9BILA|nr:hypothetical protein WR25_25130 [Diploscapter pachys]